MASAELTPLPNDNEVGPFGVPCVMTAKWMREHIAKLQILLEATKSELGAFLQKHPDPKGDLYHEGYRLRMKREGCLDLIEMHSNTLRKLEAEEAAAAAAAAAHV